MLAAFLLLSASGRVHADPLSEARQAIGLAHAKIDAALSVKNIPATTAACTPDFISINPEGKRFNAAQVRSDLADSLRNARSVQSVTTIQSILLTTTGATATIVQHMNVASHYRVLFVQRLAHTTLDQTRREEWLKTRQGWQLALSKTLANKSHTKL